MDEGRGWFFIEQSFSRTPKHSKLLPETTTHEVPMPSSRLEGMWTGETGH